MNKIPVFGTVSRAYGFLIGDFGTILRLAWAPLLGAAIVQYYIGSQVMDAMMQATATSDPTRIMAYAPQNFLLGCVQFLAGIIATVALLRVVISGDRKPGLFVYFWFGSAEIRLVAVYILLFIAAIAAFVGFGIVFAILAALVSQVPALGVVLIVAVFALMFVVLWVVLRLTLIAPVIVAESGLGVERSWALTRGNALRLLFIILLTFVPLAFITGLIFFAVLGGDFPAFPDVFSMAKPGGAGQAAVQEAIKTWQAHLMEAYRKHWPEVSALGLFYTIVSTALFSGMSGSAYIAASGKSA
jgi:hypothetical protein